MLKRLQKKGISAVLQDITNVCEQTHSQSAHVKARRVIQTQQRCYAPRGNPSQGARAKCRPPAAVLPEPASVEPATLSDMMDDEHIISDASESLLEHIQRIASFEIQKAMAITIMITAITKWDCSILEAASQAADCCGSSSKTVRQ